MASVTQSAATIDDLYRVSEKAELIAGRIVPIMPSGDAPNSAALEIVVSLREYARRTGIGVAYTDGIRDCGQKTIAQWSPIVLARRLISHGSSAAKPDAVCGGCALTFAVEVRSENDYGVAAEAAMSAKRADYFAAGTLVVWDVDRLLEWFRFIVVIRIHPNSRSTPRAKSRKQSGARGMAVSH